MSKAFAVCICWLVSTFAYSATVNMLSCCPGENTTTATFSKDGNTFFKAVIAD